MYAFGVKNASSSISILMLRGASPIGGVQSGVSPLICSAVAIGLADGAARTGPLKGGVGEISGSLGGDLARDLRVEGKGEIDLLARLHRGRLLNHVEQVEHVGYR